jgi:shikimate kinase
VVLIVALQWGCGRRRSRADAGSVKLCIVSLVFVTGISGAGKSTVCVALQERGYEAHDMDLEGNAAWIHRETGRRWPPEQRPDTAAPDWFEQYEWRVVPEKIEALAERARDRLIFVVGMATNAHEMWHLFSRVIFLSIDEPTLRRRLASRTTNDFGKTPNELAAIVELHEFAERQHRQAGAKMIDATLPPDRVVDAVLEAALEEGT